MKRSSMLSRVFFRRPAVRELVPDLKLLLAVLTVGCESHAGVWRPAGIGEDTGLDAAALDGGMADLERRSHVLYDRKTGEVFLMAWYRDNTFNTPTRQGQWRDDFKQVESPRLRMVVMEAIDASPECGLHPKNVDNSNENQDNQSDASQGQGEGEGEGIGKAAANAAPNAASSETNAAKPTPPLPLAANLNQGPVTKVRRVRPSGIVTWMEPPDIIEADRIEAEATPEEIEGACAKVQKATGKDPVPGMVWKEIGRARARQRAEEAYQARLNAPPAPSGSPPTPEEKAGGGGSKGEGWNKTLEALPPHLQPKKRAA